MRKAFLVVGLAFATGTLGCGGGGAPLKMDAAGAAGHAGADGAAGGQAGTTGEAGTSGVAGTSGAAGADAAAGTGAVAGTNGAAGTTDGGAAGTTDGGAAGTTDGGAAGSAGDASSMDVAIGAAGNGDASDAADAPDVSGVETGPGDAALEAVVDAPPSPPDALLPIDGSATLPNGFCVSGAFKRGDGVCQCQPDIPTVCGAACINLQIDDANCGTCGNACGPTATCQAGKCGVAPTTLLAPPPSCQRIDLAVTATSLFWTSAGQGTVSSMPSGGGTASPFATNEVSPSSIAVNGSNVLWLAGPRTIRRSFLGGLPTTILTSGTDIGGFVISDDGTTVFYSAGTSVLKVSIAGGASQQVVSELHGGQPRGLAMQGNTLLAFPTAVNGDVDVVTLAPAQVSGCGGVDQNGEPVIFTACARVARSQGSLFLDMLLFQNNRVIWADGTNLKMQNPFVALANDNILQTNLSDITGLAATANTVYVGENGDNGEGGITKAPLAKDQIGLRIARGQNGPRSLAVDGSRIFWSTSDCAIRAAPL